MLKNFPVYSVAIGVALCLLLAFSLKPKASGQLKEVDYHPNNVPINFGLPTLSLPE
jgi:hypothetical protein